MERLLKLKHWQLFILVFSITFISQFFLTSESTQLPYFLSIPAFVPLIKLVPVVIYFAWVYSIGIIFNRLLPQSVKMNLTRFKLFLFIPLVYIVVFIYFVPYILENVMTSRDPENMGYFILLIPAHLFSLFCIFYCFYFIAKTIKSIELQRPVTFSDFAGEFFLIWFYPIGVWLIQPRVNKILENAELPSDFLS